MNPRLSNLDIPEIRAAAAEWAFVSSQIEKIALHRFKPSKLPGREGPFYAIIIWVTPEVDVNIPPWLELSVRRVGEAILPGEQVREQYIAENGMFDREQARRHPLYSLWTLFWELSAKESKVREGFYSYYRDGFERSDFRFDWFVILLNVGNENVFEPGEIYDDLDNTDLGSILLFARNSAALRADGTTTQPSVNVESCTAGMNDNHPDPIALNIEGIKITEAPQKMQGPPEGSPAQNTAAENPPRQGYDNSMLFDKQVWEEALRLYKILLQTGFDGPDVKKLQGAAKADLAQNRRSYKFIKQKHLNEMSLFALNPGQERRDFIGRLLQMITRGNRRKKPIGAQRLYEFGKKNYRNHN